MTNNLHWKVKTRREKQKFDAIKFAPKRLRSRLIQNHRFMEKILDAPIPMYNFDEMKYIRGLEDVDVPKYYKEQAKIILTELIPWRNDTIRSFCKRAILPPMQGITPCFLVSDLKFPCYVCKFKYTSFSKNLVRLNEEEREAAMKQLISHNERIPV